MALHKYPQYLQQSTNDAFDVLHGPGARCPHSGIYRCENCGDEVASNAGNSLPPQNHRQHQPSQGPVQWRLVVFAVQQK